MDSCSLHALVEDRIARQDQDYKDLSDAIGGLQTSMLDEMEKLNGKIETIHTRLVGDLDGSTVGWVQKVNILEVNSSALKKSQDDIQEVIKKIMPWFSVFKWTVLTVAPTFLIGFVTVITGILTGKIKIIM